MSSANIITRLKRYHQRLNGSTLEYDLSFYQDILNEINELKNKFEEKSDNELKKISQMLIDKAKKGKLQCPVALFNYTAQL